ncbi:MAG: prepilin peptidase [Acidobacteria bacterium]|nr:prepilin peptidase [Acidobacteriota bacterium]
MTEACLAGLFGLLIGSFLNVCIYRMPRDLSVVRPGSFCPGCEKPVAWYDNLPLLSYVVLGGRCRQCAGRIGWRYPLVEMLTAVSFFAAVQVHGVNLVALKYAIFSALIVGLIFMDLEERILADELTLGGTLIGLALSLWVRFETGLLHPFLPPFHQRWLSLAEAAFAAALTAGALWLVGALYYRIRKREGLGLGDVKMTAMIATFLGLQPALLALLAGSALGAVTGIVYIFWTRKDAATYELPFGSFLGVAALAVAWFAEPMFRWLAGFPA